MNWATFEIDEKWLHIIPIWDKKEHEFKETCHCDPRVEDLENDYILVVHNSYDGREALEEAMKILNLE